VKQFPDGDLDEQGIFGERVHRRGKDDA
jgi:hypothetical protein